MYNHVDSSSNDFSMFIFFFLFIYRKKMLIKNFEDDFLKNKIHSNHLIKKYWKLIELIYSQYLLRYSIKTQSIANYWSGQNFYNIADIALKLSCCVCAYTTILSYFNEKKTRWDDKEEEEKVRVGFLCHTLMFN